VDDDHLFSSLVTKSAVMDVNYDRLECLGGWTLFDFETIANWLPGDVYIKYLTSAYLFLIEPNCSENAMHRMRSDIVSNKTLKACAEKTGLTGFIHTKGFASKFWQPKNSIVLPDPPKGEREASGLDDLAFDLSRTPVPTAASGRPPPTNDAALQHIGDKVS
jgi:endoribonuclease Dicer